MPYLWAVPLGLFAWSVTHGGTFADVVVQAVGFYTSLLLILAGYTATLAVSHRGPVTVHQLGHLVAFEAAAFAGFAGSNAQCVAGMAPLFVIAGTTAVVLGGAMLLPIIWLISLWVEFHGTE